MANSFIRWNHIDSRDLGVKIEKYPALNRPARKMDKISVKGRSGDIFIDYGVYENYIQEYAIFAGDKNKAAPAKWSDISAWLSPKKEDRNGNYVSQMRMEKNGYYWLADSYDPDIIRLAVLQNAFEVENSWNQYGRAKLRFSCRPERFLKNGLTKINIMSYYSNVAIAGIAIAGINYVYDPDEYFPGYLINETERDASPYLILQGSGTCVVRFTEVLNGVTTVNDMLIVMPSSADGYYACVDSEEMDVYATKFDEIGFVNWNSHVSFTNGFPKFTSGARITIEIIDGPITYFQLVPRWWRL